MPKKDNKNNEDKNFAHAVISCEKTIYRKFLETIENADFFV